MAYNRFKLHERIKRRNNKEHFNCWWNSDPVKELKDLLVKPAYLK